MRLVIADTSPINYLILIGQIDLLPRLFEKIVLPSAVSAELTADRSPLPVRQWIEHPPAWLEMSEVQSGEIDDALASIDEGERAAIQLAVALHADLLLMDDRKGVNVAQAKGLLVTGTLGVLDLAAGRGLIDFSQAIHELERTNFRRPGELLKALLAKHSTAQPPARSRA